MRILLILFFVISSISLFHTQVPQLKKVVVPIQEKLTYSLDGGLTASVNGNSRAVYEIELPENTIEWFYVFSSHSDEKTLKKTSEISSLASQLTRFLDPSGNTAIATSALITPSGSSQCNIYFLPTKDDAENFLNKTDRSMSGDDSWSYITKNSFEAVSEGKIKITNVLRGKCYLGFQNPSFNSPIKVVFEASAITETVDVNMNDWAENSKNELFNLFYSFFQEDSLDENTTIDLTNCVVEKITNQLTPLQLNMQKSESEKKINEIFDECYSELEGGYKSEEQNLGSNAGSMGWDAFENGNIDKAIQFSEKALSLDSTLGWVYGNLGLFYLIKGDELKSFDYYLNAIKYLKLDRLDGKVMMKELIKDIDNALIKFPNMINPIEIRKHLESEAQQN